MSLWATRRRVQLVLTVIVLGTFCAAALVIFISHNPPTCDDGVKNGSEFGVDCGGSCPKECPIPPKQLLDLWTRAFPLADGIYAAVAYIENQNSDLYVPDVQFEIEVYDEDNTSITRSSRRTTIMPNGVTPIFVPHIITKERVVSRATFRFVNDPVFAVYKGDHDFTFSNVHYDSTKPSVDAVVTHNGRSWLREVEFVVILYDEDDVAVAASSTVVSHIDPGASRNLAYTWVHPIVLRRGPCPGGLCTREVKRVEIIPIILEE